MLFSIITVVSFAVTNCSSPHQQPASDQDDGWTIVTRKNLGEKQPGQSVEKETEEQKFERNFKKYVRKSEKRDNRPQLRRVKAAAAMILAMRNVETPGVVRTRLDDREFEALRNLSVKQLKSLRDLIKKNK